MTEYFEFTPVGPYDGLYSVRDPRTQYYLQHCDGTVWTTNGRSVAQHTARMLNGER